MSQSRDPQTPQEVTQLHIDSGFSSQFCSNPFNTLYLEPDGKIGACRHKGSDFEVGNILNSSLEDIWNGPILQTWRQEFLDGKPRICKKEIKDQQCNHCPEYNRIFKTGEYKKVVSKKPSRIAFNFNGKCNLECTMCDIWYRPNGLYDKLGFWDKLGDWITDLEEVELLSGEPMIQKDTYRLIDLISKAKPQAKWIITTNAQWKLTDFIKSQLDRIQFRNIIVSLDSTDPAIYPQIRVNGVLEKSLNTLKELRQYERERIEKGLSPLNIKVNFLIQKINYQQLSKIVDFEKEYDVEGFRTFCYGPKELSLTTWSEPEKENGMKWYLENLEPLELQKSLRIISPLLNSMEPLNRAEYLLQIKNRLNL